MNWKELEASVAQMQLETILQRNATIKGMTGDELVTACFGIMKDSKSLSESLQNQTQKLEYYRLNNPEQFESLKNNPNIMQFADSFAKDEVLKRFKADCALIVEWINDPEMTVEMWYTSLGIEG